MATFGSVLGVLSRIGFGAWDSGFERYAIPNRAAACPESGLLYCVCSEASCPSRTAEADWPMVRVWGGLKDQRDTKH